MSDDQLRDTVPALRVAISASVALLFMVMDFTWLIHDEVKLIWPRLRVSWTARMFVFARYLGMASQIFNVCFTVRMYIGIETTPTGCRFWFAYQALVIQILLAIVEGMIMHRIYALFLRNRIVLMVLISFAIGQTTSMWVSARLSFHSNKHTVTCLMVRSNPGNAFFSITTMTTNIIIFFMTFWRYFRLPTKWTQHGLGRTVFRDSGLSLTAISLMMFFMTLCSLEVIKPSMSGNITYYWFVCMLWISLGRLIVNHEKLLRNEREHGALEFTSQFDTMESTWTLEVPQLNKGVYKLGSRNGIGNGRSRPSPTTPTTLTTLTSTVGGSLPTAKSKAGRLSGAVPSTPSTPTCGSDREEGWVGGRSSHSRSDVHGDDDRPCAGLELSHVAPAPELEFVEADVRDVDEVRPSLCPGHADGDSSRVDEDAGERGPGHRQDGRPASPSPSESDPVKRLVPDAGRSPPISGGQTSKGDVPRKRDSQVDGDANEDKHRSPCSSPPSTGSEPPPI